MLFESVKSKEVNVIPERFRNALERYASLHQKPGSFLMAVLENDLLNAVCQADLEAANELRDIVLYVHNDLEPGCCHGSKEAVKKWLNQ